MEQAAQGWLYGIPPMNVGLYQSAASLSALERWQDAVSQNISSGQVTSYKKRTVQFSAQPMGEVAQDKRARIGEGLPAYFPRATYGISFQNGEVEPTNRELDLALDEVASNRDASILVVSGAGSEAFTGGLDLAGQLRLIRTVNHLHHAHDFEEVLAPFDVVFAHNGHRKR